MRPPEDKHKGKTTRILKLFKKGMVLPQSQVHEQEEQDRDTEDLQR